MKESSDKPSGNELHCAFCGKPESKAKKMVVVGKKQQPICDECISICTQIMDDSGVTDKS